jgi:hypothetical protein
MSKMSRLDIKIPSFQLGQKPEFGGMVWSLKLDQKGCSASLCVTFPRTEDLELLQVDGIKKRQGIAAR